MACYFREKSNVNKVLYCLYLVLESLTILECVTYSCVESLFAAICLYVVDDGSVKGRGAANSPGADQDDADPNLLQSLHHLLVKHDCQVDPIDLWRVKTTLLAYNHNNHLSLCRSI